MNPTAYVCIRKELDMCRFMTVQTIPIAVAQLEALSLIAGDPGNAIFRQHGLSVPEASVTEIAGVVIGQGDLKRY